MFIELVDSLRCVHPHEETWLVAVTERMVGRDIVLGRLGCPVCKVEFPIVEGVAHFEIPPESATIGETSAPPAGSEDVALRCAAFLALGEPGGFVVVSGMWGDSARELADLAHVHVLVVNPPNRLRLGDGVSGVRIRDMLPLARHSARGLAFDGPIARVLLGEGIRVVRPSGRVVAPVVLPQPVTLSELARDDQYWVAEVEAVAGPVISIGASPRV